MHPAWHSIPALALATLALAAPSRAQNAPGPCPTPRRPPVEARIVPSQPCEGADVRIAFIHACCTRVSLADGAGSPGIRLDVVTWPDSCTNVRCLPESLVVPLGRFAAGSHQVTIEYRTEWIENGSSCVSVTTETLPFTVTTECPPPTGIRFLDRVEIGRGNQQACPGDSIPVRLSGTLPDNCIEFERVEVIPSPILSNAPFGAPPTLRIVFSAPSCLGRPCIQVPVPWAATVKIPPLIPRDWRLPVEALAIDFCGPDTMKLGANTFPFTVLTSCDPAPAGCLFPGWAHPAPGSRCDAFIGPDREAQLTLTIFTGTPLAALQGTMVMQPLGLRVTNLEAVGPAAGMQLSWNPVPEGVRFVLFAADGTPIPGGPVPNPVLRLTFGQDPGAPPPPLTRVFPTQLLGADANGQAVYVCHTFAPIDASAFICRSAPCDFNADGVADVRDLVKMVRCIAKVDPCDSASTAPFDCDADNDFDLDDVICCAIAILHGGQLPPGGEGRKASLTAAMGLATMVDEAIEIPVEIAGDSPIGAARLAFQVPEGAFVSATVRAETSSRWLALHELEGGRLSIGLIGLETSPDAPAPLRFTLRLRPAPGVPPAGEVALESADFAAPDGVRLIADPGTPFTILGTIDRTFLRPGRPNPFSDTQQISLVLPRPENADLSVFDLSGRRIRTLHHGPLSAGVHPFTWDGRDESGTRMPGGVYFYLAAVDGVTAARRVVKLGAPR